MSTSWQKLKKKKEKEKKNTSCRKNILDCIVFRLNKIIIILIKIVLKYC